VLNQGAVFFRDRTRTFRVGGTRIRLRTPRQLEPTPLPGHSPDIFPMFGVVWPSGEIMSSLIADMAVEGRRIFEIGCGMALTSHLLNARRADITAMDIHPKAGEYLERNARLNHRPPIPFVNASWSAAAPALGEFDLILGSDVLYEPRHIKTLPTFLDRHARGNVLIVDPGRGHMEDFRHTMAFYGFRSADLPPPPGEWFNGVICRFER